VIVSLHLDFDEVFKKSFPDQLVGPNIRNMGHTGRSIEDAGPIGRSKVELLGRRVCEELAVSKICISLVVNPWLCTAETRQEWLKLLWFRDTANSKARPATKA